jgi:hypothetical protein
MVDWWFFIASSNLAWGWVLAHQTKFLLYFLTLYYKPFIMNFPYTYGDEFESDYQFLLRSPIFSRSAILIISVLFVSCLQVNALEPVVAPVTKSHTVADASKVVTGAVCVACGATAANIGKTPFQKFAVFAVAFCTWCAAKSSPI